MTILAFDVGSRKTGVAAGQTVTGTAQGIATIPGCNDKQVWQHVSRLIAEWQPQRIVVGLPLAADGSETEACVMARSFGEEIEKRYQLPVCWINEHLSTQSADVLVRERATVSSVKKGIKKRDQLAAALILSSYLNEFA